jgi:hypothetical protein
MEGTRIKEYTKSKIPQAALLDESAGSMLYSIPFTCTEQITAFLQDFEANKEIKQLVEDISISNSTLEEVFISVTKDSEENEDGENLIEISPNGQGITNNSEERMPV